MAAATSKVVSIPKLVYGTAWKRERTQALVKQAIQAGFRGIDTAAQPEHYQEDLVGAGIRDAINAGIVKREHLYIQTKYTPNSRRLPYKANKSITCQVGDSLTHSLKHLKHVEAKTTQPYIDCLILHSPFQDVKDTKEAWRAMELHVPSFVRALGVSNVYDVDLLKTIYDFASTKPVVLQNRFYPATSYDSAIRAFCAEKGITYQSFWTLTANPELLGSDLIRSLAKQVGVSEAVALYALVQGLSGKMSVLDGTTNQGRMREDLDGISKVDAWKTAEGEKWEDVVARFRGLVD